jgi:hypothetical protein
MSSDPNTERMTVKRSTIFISVGNRTEVFGSVEEVPAPLRRKLQETTQGINSATILIADRKGREEILRALQGLPSSLRPRLAQSLVSRLPGKRSRQEAGFFEKYWMEMLIPATLGFCLWMSLKYVGF